MIPYEDLERALARWKTRRAGTVEAAPVPREDDERTPSGILAGAAYLDKDSTGELDLSDAEVDEAQ